MATAESLFNTWFTVYNSFDASDSITVTQQVNPDF